MRIGKRLIVPVVCMAAFTLFGQGAPNVGKTVEELKKYISLGTVTTSDFRDDNNQKMTMIKTTSEQDKDMGFEGVMRFTVELTGKDGEVWYGQVLKPQGKKKVLPNGDLDYLGSDLWSFQFSQGNLKYPKMAYAMEYGYTNANFVAIDQKFVKCSSADEIMARNKNSKNLIKIKGKGKAQHQGEGDNE